MCGQDIWYGISNLTFEIPPVYWEMCILSTDVEDLLDQRD